MRGLLKAEYLHITVAIGVPSTAEHIHITVVVRTSLKAEYLLLICFGIYFMSE